MRTFSAGKTSHRGFTLIEMVVVLVLLAVAVSLVSGVNLRQRDSLTVREFGTSLAAFLQLARSAALADGRKAVCLLDIEGRRVHSPGLERSVPVPPGVEVQRRPPFPGAGGGSVRLMEYFMDGSSSGGGIAIAMGEHAGLIEVDPLLGGVRVRW
jgi:general secretion pathway protein H